MKIGVTTFINTNYGTTLQMYALQKKLKELGAETYVLEAADVPLPMKSRIKQAVKKPRYYGYLMKYKLKKSGAEYKKKNESVKSFIAENITLKRCRSEEDKRKMLLETDAFIAGSDQLWNPTSSIRNEFLLRFDPIRPVRKYSYAVSMGVESLTKGQKAFFKRALKDFSNVSLRENEGVRMLESALNVRKDLDPTLLYNSSEWEKLAEAYNTNGEDYLFVYMLRPDKNVIRIAKEIAKRKNLKIFYTGNLYFKDPEITTITDACVSEFLGLIKNASCMITNSFHGTAFSLQFGTPVLSVGLKDSGARTRELLDIAGLQERLIAGDEAADTLIKILDTPVDFSAVEEKLNVERIKSIQYLQDIVADAAKAEDEYIKQKQEKCVCTEYSSLCCGCGACAAACPVNAVALTHNKSGFCYAEISREKCISCGKCKKVCPIQNKETECSKPVKGYALALGDNAALYQSASGGAFTALAEAVLKKNGVVFGSAQIKENGKLVTRHISVEAAGDLSLCRGSKYVQSDTSGIFEQVKSVLKAGRAALFTGTPCQIAAVKNYVGSALQENLYTADLICHGVASEKIFQDFIMDFERKNECQVSQFRFRSKKKGWDCASCELIYNKNGKEYNINKFCYAFSYMYYFLNGLIYRPSCYNCPYANDIRPGDVTIGDFWGIQTVRPDLLKADRLKAHTGISCVLANTQKGKQLIGDIMGVKLYDTECSDIINNNSSLRKPTRKPANYDMLLADYEQNGYAALQKRYDALGMKFKLRNRIISRIPRLPGVEKKTIQVLRNIKKGVKCCAKHGRQ